MNYYNQNMGAYLLGGLAPPLIVDNNSQESLDNYKKYMMAAEAAGIANPFEPPKPPKSESNLLPIFAGVAVVGAILLLRQS